MKLEHTSKIFQKTTIRLLSRLQKITPASRPCDVVYVTSADDGEGKSFVSASIAAHAALMTDRRVLLVDGNMENPSLHRYFNLQESPGLSDALKSGDWQNLSCQETDIENLYVLPAGSQRRAGMLFKQHVVGEFLEALKLRFDLVIFDSASILRSGGNSMAHLADGIVVVIDSTSTRKQVLSHALSELTVPHEKIIGAVLNKKIRYIPGFVYKRV